jgi:hypothetical protein
MKIYYLALVSGHGQVLVVYLRGIFGNDEKAG